MHFDREKWWKQQQLKTPFDPITHLHRPRIDLNGCAPRAGRMEDGPDAHQNGITTRQLDEIQSRKFGFLRMATMTVPIFTISSAGESSSDCHGVSLPDIYVYHLDKMSFLTRVIRQSIPIASRYGGVSMYSTVTPTPKEDIEKLVSANKVVVFMKGNPDVIIEMRCRIFVRSRILIVL